MLINYMWDIFKSIEQVKEEEELLERMEELKIIDLQIDMYNYLLFKNKKMYKNLHKKNYQSLLKYKQHITDYKLESNN